MPKKHKKNQEMKLYGGIDLHKGFYFYYIIDERERKVASGPVNTNEEAILDCFAPFQSLNLEVAVEIGNTTFWFCDVLERLDIKTYIVNTHANAKVFHRKGKTDKKDAKGLAFDLLHKNLPIPIYRPKIKQRQLRSLMAHRYQVVRDRVRIVNRTHAFLNRYGIKIKKSILRTSVNLWSQLIDRYQEMDNFFIEELRVHYLSFKSKTEEIKHLEALMRSLIKSYHKREYERLLTIPGIGFITAASIIATVGDWSRFKNGRQLAAYYGLAPTVRESGGKKLRGDGPITKLGIPMLRGYLVQGSISTSRSRSRDAQPLKAWYDRLKKRKGWKKARVALARKICEIAFAVVKTETNYDPLLVAKNSKPAE